MRYEKQTYSSPPPRRRDDLAEFYWWLCDQDGRKEPVSNAWPKVDAYLKGEKP